MQRDIHPAYNEVTVTCSCGNSFKTRFALDKPNLLIEVCSKCHPFYTGKQKVVNTSRVDKFKQKYRFSRLVSGKSNTGSSDISKEAA